jgi:hypothetical protein
MKWPKCPYCQRSFRPHPRVGSRQKTCGSPSCRKARKAQTDARWRRENPDCCHGDYARIKEWRKQHPHYLAQYRQSHPEYVQKNRDAQKHRDRSKKIYLDIQAQIKNQLPEITEQLWNQPDLDIQAQIPIQPLEMTFLFSSFPCLDIQAQMDSASCLRENGTILSGGDGHARKKNP